MNRIKSIRQRSDSGEAGDLLSRPRFHHVVRNALIFCAAFLTIVFSTQRSHAVGTAVNIAVDTLAFGGAFAGVSINDSEKDFAKGMAQCVVDGKTIGDCGKEALLNTILQRVPEEARNFAGCMARGNNVQTCITAEVSYRIPQQARPVATCVLNGKNVAECAKQYATDQITSAVEQATRTAEQKAFDSLKKLTEEKTDRLGQSSSTIQHIVKIAESKTTTGCRSYNMADRKRINLLSKLSSLQLCQEPHFWRRSPGRLLTELSTAMPALLPI